MTAEQIAALGWPVFALLCVIIFHAPLTRLIDRIKGFELGWPNGKIKLSTTEANQLAQALLNEADAMISLLTPADKKLFSKIVRAHEAGRPVTVAELFSEPFFRKDTEGEESDELASLRRLRDAQLIRPAVHGRFKPEKVLEIKPFGQRLLKLRRNELIGNDA